MPYFKKAPVLVGSLIFLFLLVTPCVSNAQLNILTGVDYGIIQSNELKTAVDNYNINRPNIVQELDLFNALFGISIGARYRYEIVALNLGYKAKFDRLGTQLSSDDPVEYYNFTNSGFYVGPEFFMGSSPISIGGNISYDWLKVNYKTANQQKGQTIMNERTWSTQVYLSYNFTGAGFTSLILRPYFEFNLDGYDFSGFLNAIDQSNSNNKFGIQQIGFSLIFANGPTN